jgi:hypothetical protein
VDGEGKLIYHTNVIDTGLGRKFAARLDCIDDKKKERKKWF